MFPRAGQHHARSDELVIRRSLTVPARFPKRAFPNDGIIRSSPREKWAGSRIQGRFGARTNRPKLFGRWIRVSRSGPPGCPSPDPHRHHHPLPGPLKGRDRSPRPKPDGKPDRQSRNRLAQRDRASHSFRSAIDHHGPALPSPRRSIPPGGRSHGSSGPASPYVDIRAPNHAPGSGSRDRSFPLRSQSAVVCPSLPRPSTTMGKIRLRALEGPSTKERSSPSPCRPELRLSTERFAGCPARARRHTTFYPTQGSGLYETENA